jgi:cytochrome c553
MPKVVAMCLVVLLSCQSTTEAAENVDQLIQTALMLDAHPKKGAKVYEANCGSCHGRTAEGNWKRGVPTLAGQRLAYLVKQLADFSQQERDSEAMHGVIKAKSLNDTQTWMDLAAYINALTPIRNLQIGKGDKILLGEAIFREQCSSCHNEDARGDDDGFVPALRNQHYGYLVRQMRAFTNGHRRNVDPDLEVFLNSFKDDEMHATADYLSRLKGPTEDRAQMRSNGVVSD